MSNFAREVDQFSQQDFVIVHDVLDDDDLASVQRDLEHFLEKKATALLGEGKIEDSCVELDFEHRIVALFEQCSNVLGGMDIMVMRTRGLFEFLHNEKLLDLVEALLGPEITCNPIQHLRAKMPASVDATNGFMNVPWHQDAGVTLEEADPTEIITFWIPMIDATVETGCMQVIPRCRETGLLTHIPGDYGTEIDPSALPGTPPVSAICPRGGVVVMNKYTPHRGQPNLSDMARWTIDLRYQKTGDPTGRPFHPDLIVRSQQDPESVKRDYEKWCTDWEVALANSAGKRAHRVSHAPPVTDQ